MIKSLYFLFSFFCFVNIFGQTINPEQLNDEISKLNDDYKYNDAIIKLEKIITNPKSTHFDKYQAYLQKSLTYKRLFNYPEVTLNLLEAEKHGKESKTKEERDAAEVRILVEKLFVVFDTRNFDKLQGFLDQLKDKNLNYLNAETRGFYTNVLANRLMDKKQYDEAEKILNQAIEDVTKQSPKHVAGIYVKLINLAENTKNQKKAQDAYDQGIYYAKKYKMDIYKQLLYYTMSHFHAQMQQYKEAYDYHVLGLGMTNKYHANFYNGELTVLDKDLLDQRKSKEIEYEKRIKLFFILFSIATIALLFLIIKLYQSNHQKNKLVHRENQIMRTELARLTEELDEKGNDKINIEEYNFSEKQIKIIELVKEGLTNKEIGNKLFISENTVKYHLKIIYSALGIENRWDLQN